MSRTLRAQHDRFELTQPFRIARGVKTAADVITVSVGEGGVEGRGEGVPYPRYGESVESALADIERIWPLIERGDGRRELLAAMPAGAARNAVDCALWDLEARLSGRSVAEAIGAPAPGRIATALTVVIVRRRPLTAVAG